MLPGLCDSTWLWTSSVLSPSLVTASKDSSRTTGSLEGELLLPASCLLKTSREPEPRPPRGGCARPRRRGCAVPGLSYI